MNETILEYPDHYIARDGWGKYYNFTGYESPDKCFWCGKPTRWRYCQQTDCRQNYVKRFNWREAKLQCLREARVGGRFWHTPSVKCHDCGIVGYTSHYSNGRDDWFYSYKGTSQRGQLQQLMEFEGITYIDGFQVHHVWPICGEDRNWHWLNQWVVCLCKPCHIQRHRELNYLERQYKEALSPPVIRPPDPQLSFSFTKGGGE